MEEVPALSSQSPSWTRRRAGQSSTAVEKQIHGVVSPRVELARRHGYAHTHGATLRLSNDHMQKLRGREASKLDGQPCIGQFTREQIANQRRRLLSPTL